MKASSLSFPAAVLMAVAAMIWGIVMAITEDHSATSNPTWGLTLTRKAATSSYDAYTVTFTQKGFATSSTDSSIMAASTIEICPMGN